MLHVPIFYQTGVQLDITSRNIRSRLAGVLLFLRLYEPYRRLLRLFRFNDRHRSRFQTRPIVVVLGLASADVSPPPAFGRTLTFGSSRFVSLEAAAARMRKLEPLEFAIGCPERSIFESLFAQSAISRICRSRKGSREILGRDVVGVEVKGICTQTPIVSIYHLCTLESSNHDSK